MVLYTVDMIKGRIDMISKQALGGRSNVRVSEFSNRHAQHPSKLGPLNEATTLAIHYAHEYMVPNICGIDAGLQLAHTRTMRLLSRS
eukprot:scaffold223517_cov19-Prasinocladus_malaysianus.AAC.2